MKILIAPSCINLQVFPHNWYGIGCRVALFHHKRTHTFHIAALIFACGGGSAMYSHNFHYSNLTIIFLVVNRVSLALDFCLFSQFVARQSVCVVQSRIRTISWVIQYEEYVYYCIIATNTPHNDQQRHTFPLNFAWLCNSSHFRLKPEAIAVFLLIHLGRLLVNCELMLVCVCVRATA